MYMYCTSWRVMRSKVDTCNVFWTSNLPPYLLFSLIRARKINIGKLFMERGFEGVKYIVETSLTDRDRHQDKDIEKARQAGYLPKEAHHTAGRPSLAS